MPNKTNSSTLRGRRRAAFLSAAARRLTGDPTMTWRQLETLVLQTIDIVAEGTPDNAEVAKNMHLLLAAWMGHVRAMPGGPAKDINKILVDLPRQQGQRK